MGKFSRVPIQPQARNPAPPGPNSLRGGINKLTRIQSSARDEIQKLKTSVTEKLGELNSLIQLHLEPPTLPSANAFKIVAALGQVRDALCDQHKASAQIVNDQLDKVAGRKNPPPPKSIADSRMLLQPYSKLSGEFEQQLRELSTTGDFEAERRQRLAELVGFELRVLATVTDSVAPLKSTGTP